MHLNQAASYFPPYFTTSLLLPYNRITHFPSNTNPTVVHCLWCRNFWDAKQRQLKLWACEREPPLIKMASEPKVFLVPLVLGRKCTVSGYADFYWGAYILGVWYNLGRGSDCILLLLSSLLAKKTLFLRKHMLRLRHRTCQKY
jgi:hypothetical protein